MVNIFEYTKFRKFLAAYQEARSRIEPKFSRAELCRRLGFLNTRSYFNDILRDKKLTANMTERFIELMELSAIEANYFRAMVDFDQGAPEVKKRAFQRMIDIHPTPETILHSDDYAFYSKWYNSAVFAILDVLDIKDDYREIEEKIFPKISLEKITEAIELLQKLGLVRRDENGFLKPSKDRIATEDYDKSEFVKAFQKQCLELSKEAIDSGEESTNLTTLTFSVSQKTHEKIEREMKLFRKKLSRLIAEDMEQSEFVEHLNLHLFSVLKKGGKNA